MPDLIAIIVSLTALLAWFNHRFIGLPTTIGVMALALALSWGLHGLAWLGWSGIEDLAENLLARIDFSELLMEGMLSMLLFAGALHIDLDRLRRYRWSIGFLATLGVVISTLVVGSMAYWLLGTFGFGVPWLYCLVFGALISPTDPIAVLSILRQAGAPEDLELRIVGESLFNDGVAVVVFTLLLGVVVGEEALSVGHAGKLFLLEAGGGVALGLVVGGLAYRLMSSIDEYRIEVLLSLALALSIPNGEVRDALLTVTYLIVLFSILVQGLTIGHVVKRLLSDP